MGPLQHSLTTAPPFKCQKILFKARAPGWNLIHRRLSRSQLPILDPPSPVTWFTSPFPRPPPPPLCAPSPSRASRGSAIHVFLVEYIPSVWGIASSDKWKTRQQEMKTLTISIFNFWCEIVNSITMWLIALFKCTKKQKKSMSCKRYQNTAKPRRNIHIEYRYRPVCLLWYNPSYRSLIRFDNCL